MLSYEGEWFSGKPLQPGMKCPICEGHGRWHDSGALCTSRDCTVDATVCPMCNGKGFLPVLR